MASLGHVVGAARREGIPVVSLSWAVDCVVRGTRVRQQSRPEYLSPFLEESMGAVGRPRGAAAGAAATRGPFSTPTSVPVGGAAGSARGRSSPLLPAAMFGARASPSRLLVFSSRAGDRYEVNDCVHFSTEEPGTSARRVCSKTTGGNSSTITTTTTTTTRSDCGVGRIVCLEQAGNGRIFATIEPLQKSTNKQSGTTTIVVSAPAPAHAAASSIGGVFHLGVGGSTTHPSAESSVSRGRARRARELKKVAEGVSRQKVDASCLRGRVTVLPAREFDARRGFCDRDPDVYAQRGPSRAAR